MDAASNPTEDEDCTRGQRPGSDADDDDDREGSDDQGSPAANTPARAGGGDHDDERHPLQPDGHRPRPIVIRRDDLEDQEREGHQQHASVAIGRRAPLGFTARV